MLQFFDGGQVGGELWRWDLDIQKATRVSESFWENATLAPCFFFFCGVDVTFGLSVFLNFVSWIYSIADHQTFQVPRMEVLTYICCMDTAYVRENTTPLPKIRFRKPSIVGTWNSWWPESWWTFPGLLYWRFGSQEICFGPAALDLCFNSGRLGIEENFGWDYPRTSELCSYQKQFQVPSGQGGEADLIVLNHLFWGFLSPILGKNAWYIDTWCSQHAQWPNLM